MQKLESAITVRERPEVKWSGSKVGLVTDLRNNLAQGVNVLTQFIGAKTLPRSLRELSMLPTLVNEAVLNPSETTPSLFWTMVVDKITHLQTGAGQRKDLTPAVGAWMDQVTEAFRDNKVNALSADFIYTGMRVLLAEFQIPAKRRALTEEMREALGKIYQKLVLSENLQGGWEQIHADLIGTLRTSTVDAFQTNPTIGGEHKSTEIVHNLVEDLSDKQVGLGSEFDKYLRTESGEHIFSVEWRKFTESEQLKAEPVETKVKLMTELRHEIPTAFKAAKDPGQKSALQMAYVEASSQIVDSQYAEFRTNVMVQAEKAVGEVKPADVCLEGVEAELSPLLDILADPYSGIDGFKVTKQDSIKTIADAVKLQYEELWTAIEEGGSLELKGIFVEVARKKVLEALKKSRYAEFQDLYQALVKDADPDGVKKMYARKYSQIEVPEDKENAKKVLEEEAKKGIQELLAKITDDTYGIQEEYDLSSVFIDELDQLISAVSDFNPQLGTAFAEAADQLLVEMRKTTRQKALGIAKVYDAIQKGFKGDRAIDAVDLLCADPIEPTSVIANALQYENEPGVKKIWEEQQKQQALEIEANEMKPARDFWNGVLEDIIDIDYGVSGSKADISPSIVDYIKQVAEELKTKAPEYQRRFIKAGIEAIVPTIGNVNAQKGAATKLVELFHDVLMGDTLAAGRQHMYEHWMHDPYQLEQVMALTYHDTVGQGATFSVVQDVYRLLDGFIKNAEQRKNDSQAPQENSVDDQRAYLTFIAVEENVKKAIREIGKKGRRANTDVQNILAKLYESTSEKLGNAAMRHLVHGELMTQARKAAEGVKETDKFDTTRDAEVEAIQKVWDTFWQNYYDIAYGSDTLQGAPGSMLKALKANMRRFEDALSTADEPYTVAYLESGVQNAFKYLKQRKGVNFDTRQRVAFDTLRLLGHSESKLVQTLAARENPVSEDEPRGAKRVRTLGGVQTRFIKAAIQDTELMKSFTQYIETKPAPGKFKDKGELRLCMELLMTARDFHMMRRTQKKANKDENTGLEIGVSPTLDSLTKMEDALIASLESLTNNLMGDKPEMNAVFELIAAIGMFSPHTLTRLSYATNDLRNMKNVRKGKPATRKAMQIIESKGLDPDEEFFQIWRTAGKEQFNLGQASEFSPELKQLIKSAVTVGGEDLITLVQTFRGDVCRVVDQPPGLQYFFGRDWQDPKVAAPRLRNIFERYLAGFARRFDLLESGDIQTDQAKKVIATELLAVSMMFEQFANDMTEVKKGPHKKFFKILRGILYDRARSGNERKYSNDVHNVLNHIIKFSLPHWNQELVKDFFEDMFNHANNNEFSTWIEQGRWKELCDDMTILPKDATPTFMDVRLGLQGLERSHIAQLANDATLKILKSYTYLSGPKNIRLAYDIISGTRTPGIPAIDTGKAPVSGNFIEQAINNIAWYGTPQQQEELITVLEELGRHDALMLVQTTDMRPPETQFNFIQKSKGIAGEMARSMERIYKDYVVGLSAVVTGIKPVMKYDAQGNIKLDELPTELTAFKTFVENQGQEALKQAAAESGYTALVERAKQEMEKLTTDKIEGLQGTKLIETLLKYATAQSGGETIYSELLNAMKELLSKVQFPTTSGATTAVAESGRDIDVQINKNVNNVGAMLGMLREQTTVTADVTGKILESVSGLRQAIAKVAQDMAVQTGASDTAKVAEQLTQALIKQISAVVTDESEAQRLVGVMRKQLIETAQAELNTWTGLERRIVTMKGALTGQEMGEVYEQARAELGEYRKKRQAHYTARNTVIESMNLTMITSAKNLTHILEQAKQLELSEYTEFVEWLKKISGVGEAEESTSVRKRLDAYAEYCNLRFGRAMKQGSIKGDPALMTKLRVNRQRMMWTPEQYLRALGYTIQGGRVVALSADEINSYQSGTQMTMPLAA